MVINNMVGGKMRTKRFVLAMLLSFSIMLIGCEQVSNEDDAVSMQSSSEEVESVDEVEVVEAVVDNSTESISELLEVEVDVVDTEEALMSVLSAVCSDTLMVFIRDDFDGNGVFEAVAATSKDPNAIYFNDPENALDCYDDVTIWYVTTEKAVALDDVSNKNCFVNIRSGIFADGTKVVFVDFYMSHVDTDTYVFTFKDDAYNYLGVYSSAGVTDDGLFYTGHYFWSEESRTYETEIYEYSDGKFILKETLKEDM